MFQYFDNISIDNIIYSIDMIRLKLDFSSEKRISAFGEFLTDITKIYVETFPVSYKAYQYRNLFKITCDNNNTFVIGLSFNGNDKDSYYLGFMEFNPNKVVSEPQFLEIFDTLRLHCFTAEVVRWDLAIDVPLARDMCLLVKDKRKYSLVQNSELDKTEHLGQRNKQGFVKLYNKRIESDLDYDLTRLEITLNGDCSYSDFCSYLPRIDVKGDQQSINPYLVLNDTDLVLYELLNRLDLDERRHYMKRLGRRKSEKLEPFIYGTMYDSDKFIVSKDVFIELRKKLRKYTLGIDYTILDDMDLLN